MTDIIDSNLKLDPFNQPDDMFDVDGEAFGARFGGLLADRRRTSGRSRRDLARQSDGTFTAQRLRKVEAARCRITVAEAAALLDLYGADIDRIRLPRLAVKIAAHGVISAAGIAVSFTPHDSSSLLLSYLRLVRQLRGQERPAEIVLRRDDIEALAEHLDESGETIVDRLAALMGASQTQRRAMVGMFAAGALLIGLAAAGVASGAAAAGSTAVTVATTPVATTPVATTPVATAPVATAPVATIGAQSTPLLRTPPTTISAVRVQATAMPPVVTPAPAPPSTEAPIQATDEPPIPPAAP